MVSMGRRVFIPAQSGTVCGRILERRLLYRVLGRGLRRRIWLPHQHQEEPARLPLLCESREGYQNLCQLITQFKMRERTKSEGAATCEDLAGICVRAGVPDGRR